VAQPVEAEVGDDRSERVRTIGIEPGSGQLARTRTINGQTCAITFASLTGFMTGIS
jgi:hypothetical protein